MPPTEARAPRRNAPEAAQAAPNREARRSRLARVASIHAARRAADPVPARRRRRRPDRPVHRPLHDRAQALDDRVRESIQLGRPNMPAFRNVLDDNQLNDLLAYLHTL